MLNIKCLKKLLVVQEQNVFDYKLARKDLSEVSQ